MKGALGMVSLEAAGCSHRLGTGLCGLPLQLPTVLWQRQVRLGLEKQLSATLWMCASSGHRLPRQTGTIRFLSTSHRRMVLLRMTSRMGRKDSFTHHCLNPPKFLDPSLEPCRGCRQSAKECFGKHHLSDSPSSVKNEDIPELCCGQVQESQESWLFKCHLAAEHGIYRPTYPSRYI